MVKVSQWGSSLYNVLNGDLLEVSLYLQDSFESDGSLERVAGITIRFLGQIQINK